MATPSSLSSVVSNLVRASMGTAVDPSVPDEDIDRHVADLILKEAKQKEAQYLGSAGIRAYVPDDETESSVPKPNKRFLSSIIRNVDEHNAAIINQQAKAALSVREQLQEEENKVNRARADEAAKDRLRRLMGDSHRRQERDEGGTRRRGDSYGSTSRRESEMHGRDRGVYSRGDPGPSSGSHRSDSHRSRRHDTDYAEGSLKANKGTREDTASGTEEVTEDDQHHRRRRHRSPTSPGRASKDGHVRKRSRSSSRERESNRRRRDVDGDYYSSDDRRSWSKRSRRSSRSRSPPPRQESGRHSRPRTPNGDGPISSRVTPVDPPPPKSTTPRSHPLSKSVVPSSRSPSPLDDQMENTGPPAPIPSKMDKYFDPAYDPLLDVGPSQPSLNDLVPEGAFEHWNRMLELMKLRKEDKVEKKRKEKDGGKTKSKSKKRKTMEDEELEADEERKRRIRLGIEKPTVMDMQYAKRGAIREWDVGKEVT